MKRCSNCNGIIKETAAVITTYIHPGEAGAVQWKVIKSKYDIEKAKRVQWNFGENFAENHNVKIWERKIFGKLWRNQREKKTLIRR